MTERLTEAQEWAIENLGSKHDWKTLWFMTPVLANCTRAFNNLIKKGYVEMQADGAWHWTSKAKEYKPVKHRKQED